MDIIYITHIYSMHYIRIMSLNLWRFITSLLFTQADASGGTPVRLITTLKPLSLFPRSSVKTTYNEQLNFNQGKLTSCLTIKVGPICSSLPSLKQCIHMCVRSRSDSMTRLIAEDCERERKRVRERTSGYI